MSHPTFIIAGAQKAGTTSLAAMLGNHPHVFMSDPKEPGYFIRGFAEDAERWQTCLRPYSGKPAGPLADVKQGVFTSQDYTALFASPAAREAAHRGEASTPYLPSPHAAQRIAETYPDAKIILALRDPVTRAYSAWGHNHARGNEVTDSFEAAMDQELAGQRDAWIWGWRYLYSGLYGQHVARYLEHFPREQVLILKFEDFRGREADTFAQLCDFLDLPQFAPEAGQKENVTVRHTNPLLGQLRAALTGTGALKSGLRAIMPKGLRRGLRKGAMKAIDQFGDRPEALAPNTRARLAAYYAADCAELQTLTGLDLSDWTPLATKEITHG